MKSRLECEFFLIRYFSDAAREEFTNIGVVLQERGREREGLVRFTRSWRRVRCLDADADVALFEALETEIATRLGQEETGGSVLKLLSDTLSNAVQITEPRACLAESLPAELDQLMRVYVEPRERVSLSRQSGRAAIAGAMRREFERAGVWALMRRQIAASVYTGAGDPMRIDCGYRPNGVIRMFQAVSLEGSVEGAKVLAYSAARLRDGVFRVENAQLELSAVIEPLREVGDGGNEHTERYRFGVEAMEREQIRVLTVKDLARAAETARSELGV